MKAIIVSGSLKGKKIKGMFEDVNGKFITGKLEVILDNQRTTNGYIMGDIVSGKIWDATIDRKNKLTDSQLKGSLEGGRLVDGQVEDGKLVEAKVVGAKLVNGIIGTDNLVDYTQLVDIVIRDGEMIEVEQNKCDSSTNIQVKRVNFAA